MLICAANGITESHIRRLVGQVRLRRRLCHRLHIRTITCQLPVMIPFCLPVIFKFFLVRLKLHNAPTLHVPRLGVLRTEPARINQLSVAVWGQRLHDPLDLEEPPQPPDLEDRLADDDADDEDVPPLDPAVCALGGVSVGALADDNVRLLVLDLGEDL